MSRFPNYTNLWYLAEPEKWECTHNDDVKIINDELFLARTHRLYHQSILKKDIPLKVVEDFHLPVCLHVRGWGRNETKDAKRPHYRTQCIPEIEKQGEYTQIRQVAIGSCAKCPTDYIIRLDWGFAGHFVELTSYHRLGDCRNPLERTWFDLLGVFLFGPLRKKDLKCWER